MDRRGAGCAITVVLCLLVGGCCVETGDQRRLTGTVEQAYAKRSVGGDKFFVVLKTADGSEVFENTDSVWFGKYDSAGLNAKLRAGRKVAVDVAGYRVPFLSMFPNVVGVSP